MRTEYEANEALAATPRRVQRPLPVRKTRHALLLWACTLGLAICGTLLYLGV